MANLDQVLESLRLAINAVLLAVPLGPTTYDVCKGWPEPEDLEAAINRRITTVSIYKSAMGDKRLPSIPSNYVQTTDVVVHLGAIVSGTQFAGGTASAPASASVTLTGVLDTTIVTLLKVNDVDVTYHPVLGNTLAQAATGLAAAFNATLALNTLFLATAVGPVVTFTRLANGVAGNTTTITFAIGGNAILSREVAREQSTFELHVWTYDDPTRGLFANSIMDAFADDDMLTFADGTMGRLLYQRNVQTDMEVKQGIYRRILYYSVEYARIRSIVGTQVLEGTVQITGS